MCTLCIHIDLSLYICIYVIYLYISQYIYNNLIRSMLSSYYKDFNWKAFSGGSAGCVVVTKEGYLALIPIIIIIIIIISITAITTIYYYY